MIKFLFSTFFLAIGVSLIAQSWNPYLNQGIVSPAPMLPVEFGGTGILSVNVGNSGSSPLPLVVNDEIKLIITLSNGLPESTDPLAAIGGTALGWFNWTYNDGTNTYTGIQNQIFPGEMLGNIFIAYRVTVNTPLINAGNGFIATLIPPDYAQNINSQDDDVVSSYTFVRATDFGDAPLTYGSAGAYIDLFRDVAGNYERFVMLGDTIDHDSAYLGSALADGDDTDGIDDEDGVVFPLMIQGTSVNIPVLTKVVGGLGFLNGWIDWNGDGDFLDAGEQIANNILVFSTQVTNLSVFIPIDANANYTFARFIFGEPVFLPSGFAAYGEVEDYRLLIRGSDPLIDLVITGTYQDNNPLGIYNEGDVINYQFIITNTGGVPLTNIFVTDPLVIVSGDPIPVLNPGQTDNTTFTAVKALTQSDINFGKFTNIASVTGYSQGNQVVDNDIEVVICGNILPQNAIKQDNKQSHYADLVQLGTGTFTIHKSDLRIPVIDGNIEFSRYYNSLNNEVSGPLGYGWSHSYRYSLVNRQDTAWDVHYADGHLATFIPLDELGNSYPLYSGTVDSLQKNSDHSYSLYTREKIRYQFDTDGRLDSIIDLNGNATVLYYTGAILDSIVGPGGRLIELGYTGDKITSVKDPLNRYIYYEYDENDNLIKVINANSDTSRFVYDDAHLLLTAFNNLGDTVVHNTYDPLTGKVISQKDGHQQLTIFEYDTPEVGATSVTNPDNSEFIVVHDVFYRKTDETDELGFSRTYDYDINSNEIRVTSELGDQINRLYDNRANLLSDTLPGNRITDVVYNHFNSPLHITDANGNQKFIYYDPVNNNLDSVMMEDGTKIRYTYDNSGQMTQMTDGKGNITNYIYSVYGDLLSIQSAAGTRHFTYDAAGRKLSETDENGHATTYTYDLNNNVLVVTDPLGKTVESTYDANNQLLSIKDKNGSITYYSYDKKGRKVSSTDPLGEITTYVYDVRDNLISVTDPNNHVVSYTYDAANRKNSMTNAIGTTQYTYDAVGNLIRVTDPDNRFTDYTYTPSNKKASMTDGLSNLTSYTYDYNDNLISMTDALNRTTVYAYDVMDRLVNVTDPAGNVTTVGYDATGNRQTVTDPNGHPISYTYDAANRLISSTDAAGNVISYTLDNNGNITTITKPTGTITKTFDALNRIMTVANSTGDNYTFTYDNNGNVLTMTNLTGTSEMEYDSLNRLVLYTDPFGKSVGFEYDDAGNKTSIVYPGNKTVNYSYDGANNLVTVTDWLGKIYTYSYDASGRIKELLYPNEIRCNYTYDQAGRLISRIYYDADSTVLSGSYFDLNPVGNRISEQKFGQQSGVPEDLSRVYAYTADDVMLSDSIWTYTHDLSGNRIAETDGTANASYTFTVDNLLTGRINANADVFSYTYNPLGHRLSVTEGTEVKRFVVDISTSLSKVLQITDENGEVIADYIYGLGLLGQIDSLDNPLYYHFDGQHNTIMLTDENAAIQDWYSYDPFGTTVTHTGSTEQPFTFLGEYGVEAEAPGLYYVRARYYDAMSGRFLSKDTYEYDLNYPQTINRYVYGLNSPVFIVDFTGLCGQNLNSKLEFFNTATTTFHELLWNVLPQPMWNLNTTIPLQFSPYAHSTNISFAPLPSSQAGFLTQSNSFLGQHGGTLLGVVGTGAILYDIKVNNNTATSRYADLSITAGLTAAGLIAAGTVAAPVVAAVGITYGLFNLYSKYRTGKTLTKRWFGR